MAPMVKTALWPYRTIPSQVPLLGEWLLFICRRRRQHQVQRTNNIYINREFLYQWASALLGNLEGEILEQPLTASLVLSAPASSAMTATGSDTSACNIFTLSGPLDPLMIFSPSIRRGVASDSGYCRKGGEETHSLSAANTSSLSDQCSSIILAILLLRWA